jgi:hypothetical protein
VERNEPEELLYAVLSAALYGEDANWAENICINLADHPHFNVRGNALLGFGHIARLHRRLTQHIVQPLLEAGLTDPDEYVRGQSHSALSDVEHFLGWRTSLPDPYRDWREGVLPPGVQFTRGSEVIVTGGPHLGLRGVIQSLILGPELEPEYLVEFETGEDAFIAQSALTTAR